MATRQQPNTEDAKIAQRAQKGIKKMNGRDVRQADALPDSDNMSFSFFFCVLCDSFASSAFGF